VNEQDGEHQHRENLHWENLHRAHQHGESAAAAPGLRERKKQATRQALARAAMQLALDRGFDNLRVEDIAEAAGVSPRTFNNYFSSREQAICAASIVHVERMAAALRARLAGEPLIDSIVNVVAVAQGEPPRAMVRLVEQNPALCGEWIRTFADRQAPLIEAVAARTGTAPGDLLPQVVTAAVFGAMRVALSRWQDPENSQPYNIVLRDALNQLRLLALPAEAASADAASGAVSRASARPSIIGTRVA
jgi:AcrR family transcriptional regulator